MSEKRLLDYYCELSELKGLIDSRPNDNSGILDIFVQTVNEAFERLSLIKKTIDESRFDSNINQK